MFTSSCRVLHKRTLRCRPSALGSDRSEGQRDRYHSSVAPDVGAGNREGEGGRYKGRNS